MIKAKTNNKKQSFMKGVLILMVSQVLIKLLGFAYRWYMTNKPGFGDEGNGLYGAGFQIYTLLLALSSIGVPNAISKLVSEKLAVGDTKAAHRIFRIAFYMFGTIGFIGTSILFFGANFIANVILCNPRVEYTLIALSPSVFFVTVSSVIRGYFAGFQNMTATATSQTLEQIYKTVITIVILIVLTGQDVEIMAAGANLATTLATMLSFAYLYIFYTKRRKEIFEGIKKSTHYTRESIFKVIKGIICVSIPISLSSIISAINKNVDSITVIRGLKSIGWSEELANNAYGMLTGKIDTLINLPLSFNIAFAISLVPAISASISKGDKKSAKKRISFSLLVTMLIGMPCTMGLVVLAEPILKLLFPNAPDGAMLLGVSSLVIIFTLLAQTVNGALQGLGKVAIPAIALACGAMAKVFVNITLIPIHHINIYGAAIGSIICNMVSFVIAFVVLKRNIKLDLNFNKFVLKPCVATAMMCVCSIFTYNFCSTITNLKISTLISIFVAIVIYILSVTVLKIFSKEEIYMIPFGHNIYELLVKFGIYKEKIK